MTFDEAVQAIYDHGEGQFPKTCSCGRTYNTFPDYARHTTPLGRTISYDAAAGDWTAAQPLGSFALANCSCGSTLSLSTEGMPLATHHALLALVKAEVERRRVSPEVVAGELRVAVRRKVLGDNA